MPSKLYEIVDNSIPLSNPSNLLQVLADNPTRARVIACHYTNRYRHEARTNDFTHNSTLEEDLTDATWRVEYEGDLYHPGAWEGVLDGTSARRVPV